MGFLKSTFTSLIAMIIVKIIQARKLNPEKSWRIIFMNLFLWPLRWMGLGDFKYGEDFPNTDLILKETCKQLKTTDYGDDAFLKDMAAIAQTPAGKKCVPTNMGYIMISFEKKIGFNRRIRMLDSIKKYPQLQSVEVRQPVFVFGLGRSGTTFLHRLLSLDPAVRSPYLWELISPIPLKEVESWKTEGKAVTDEEMAFLDADRKKRQKFIRARLADRKKMGDDGLERYHEVDADQAEECMITLADELPVLFHNLFITLFENETFLKVASPDRVKKAYSWHKQILQMLSLQCGEMDGSRRWVLKCPLHILWLAEIAEVFPDVKFIWAHRHPVPTVTSLCALLRAVHGVYYETTTLDEEELGLRIRALAESQLAKAQRVIQEKNLDCTHVLYENLVKDPIEVVRKIYEQNNWTFTDDYLMCMQKYLVENEQEREKLRKRYGGALHSHKPEEFGMTPADLSDGVFAEYVKNLNITSNK